MLPATTCRQDLHAFPDQGRPVSIPGPRSISLTLLAYIRYLHVHLYHRLSHRRRSYVFEHAHRWESGPRRGSCWNDQRSLHNDRVLRTRKSETKSVSPFQGQREPCLTNFFLSSVHWSRYGFSYGWSSYRTYDRRCLDTERLMALVYDIGHSRVSAVAFADRRQAFTSICLLLVWFFSSS